MKIGKLLLIAVIALGLMACNNEEGPELPTSADATISIKVFPSSDTPGLRATGNLSGNGIAAVGLAAESAIKTLEAWVFVNGNLETYKTVTITDGAVTEIKDIKATSGTRTIVVAANAGIGTQTTLTALKAKTKDLSQTITGGLPMTAEPLEVTLQAGKNTYGYPVVTGENNLSTASMPLVRTNARVAIVEAKLDFTGITDPLVFDALTEVEVAIFNVPAESKLFGTSLATNSDYLRGATWPTTQGSYDQVASTNEGTLIDGTITFPIVNTAAPYYYVNENTSTETNQHTFIVLRGKPTLGDDPAVPVKAPGLYTDADGYTYYPVWVNAIKDGYTYNTPELVGHTPDGNIYRNFQYNISLTIKGIGNPTIDPAEEAILDVKVTVAPWAVVNQSVTW